MKKIILFFAALPLLLASCSDDGSSPIGVPENPSGNLTVRVAKITEWAFIDEDTVEVQTNFTYDQNNLLKMITRGSRTREITYSGTQKVTEIKDYENGTYLFSTLYHYDDDKLATVTSYTESPIKTVFHYEGDFVTAVDHQNFVNNSWRNDISEYYKNNGNVSEKITQFYYNGNPSERDSTVYAYDDKQAPFRGMNKFLKLMESYQNFIAFNNNNIVSETFFFPTASEVPTAEYTYQIAYDSFGYPTSIKKKDADDNPVSETLFEYKE